MVRNFSTMSGGRLGNHLLPIEAGSDGRVHYTFTASCREAGRKIEFEACM